LCPDGRTAQAHGLFAPILTTDAMAACTSDESWLQAMLDVEAALAEVQAVLGVIPAEAAAVIVSCCHAERFDVDALGHDGRLGANPVIPLVAALRHAAGDAGDFVHLGATSQDIADTAAMLIVQRACALALADVRRIASAAAALAEAHRETITVARTLLQHALPTTFGLKAASWLNAALDVEELLDRTAGGRLAVQLGGGAGTLAAFGADGPAVLESLAARLGLLVPVMPWHSDRTRMAEVASAFATAAGVAGKIALDVSLLMHSDVAEAFEPSAGGRGASSTLPQKRNPALSVAALASARRAAGLVPIMLGSMLQEHERGLGSLQAEWLTLTELLRAAGGALGTMAEVLEGLELDESQMANLLGSDYGLVMGERIAGELTRRFGRAEAHRILEAASRALVERGSEATTLVDELVVRLPAGCGVSEEEVATWLDPRGYLGSADWLIDRALARLRATHNGMPARSHAQAPVDRQQPRRSRP
jgi:3-carboxy-cis,cis-muconate cycloisomerase